MKKLYTLLFLGLCSCMGAPNVDYSGVLSRLETVPNTCFYLYKMDSSVSVYNEKDAFEYVEKSIVENERGGNAYAIEKQEIESIPGAVFGPKNKYIISVKVYDCSK